MKRVTGIGGVFFKANDPETLWTWYREHLGIDVQDHGVAVFHWVDEGGTPLAGATAWRIASEDDSTFAPDKTFTVNYRVADLEALLEALKDEGCDVVDDVHDDPDYGKFGWVIDPEGNKVALWEPLAGQ